MEKHTPKGTQNSGLPGSRTDPDGTARTRAGAKGKGPTPRYAAAGCRSSGYLQSMACQGYNPIAAIETALNGNAANMVEKPPRDNPANQDQKQGGE